MLANVFTKSLRDRWLGTTIAVVSLALILLFAMSIYSDIDLNIYLGMPDVVKTIMGIPATADVGSMAVSVFLTGIGAWVLAGLAIASGSSSIASEESNGTIGLLLGNPRSRTAVLVSKTASMLLLMALAVMVLWGTVPASAAILGTSLEGLHVGALSLHLFTGILFYGFLALAIGAWTGNRGTAIGVATGLMVVSIVAVGIFPLIDGWEFAAKIFPWYYLNGSEPLIGGINWGHIGIMTGCIVVFAGASVIGINRRDLKSRNVGVTIIDRLRSNPMTAKVMSRLAGSARVSRIWIKSFSEHQGLLIITGWVMILTGIMVGSIYNFMPIDTMVNFMDDIPDAFFAMVGGGDFSTPEGFIQIEMFGLMAPAALMLVTIVAGSQAIAGEESRLTMGLLLANPVKRSRVVLEKTLVMVLCAVVTGLATFAGVALGALIGGLEMSYANIAATCLLVTLLGLVFGAAALAMGSATGRTRIATFGSLGFAIVSYFVSSFFPLSNSLAGLAKWSPYYYFLGSDPLNTGMNWVHGGILAGLALALTALSVFLFQRRDLVYNG